MKFGIGGGTEGDATLPQLAPQGSAKFQQLVEISEQRQLVAVLLRVRSAWRHAELGDVERV
ncbi:MAG TPA: hypothetical protein VJR58_21630, partial [Vineibacter sp.]|nr:hypothetical protein [Vineibacter sp.]